MAIKANVLAMTMTYTSAKNKGRKTLEGSKQEKKLQNFCFYHHVKVTFK